MTVAREPQTFVDWLMSNSGTTTEIGVKAIITDKLIMAVNAERVISIMMGAQICEALAHKLYMEGFVSDKIHLEKERDPFLRAMEVYAEVEGHFEGEFPNYMVLCFEMWNASAHLQRMNPLRLTYFWARGLMRRVRWWVQEYLWPSGWRK